MNWGRSYLPSHNRTTGRFTAWLVAVFVFLSGCAFSAGTYVDSLIAAWNRSVSGTVTAQLPPAGDASARAARAIETLRGDVNVARAEVVSRERVNALLKPWLVDDSLIAELPLPILIDVELKAPSVESISAVTSALAKAVPGAIIDDHRAWLGRVMALADGFRYVSIATFLLITGALALTVVFATRASLIESTQVVEVLHMVGAHDRYVAAQFARRAAGQCLIGGVCGLLGFAPALALIGWLGGQIDQSLLPRVAMPWTFWAGLAVLPLGAMVLAALTAHLTVKRSLARMV